MKRATKFLVMVLLIGVVCAKVGARKIEKVSNELMDQKPFLLPPMPLTLPTPITVPGPLPVPIPGLGEAVSATKGGGAENEVGIVSKDTNLGISIAKTAATNGIGTELRVTVTSSATNRKYANANAAEGGTRSGATGSSYENTFGSVTVDGPNASAYSTSTAYGRAAADAAAGPDGARGNGYGYAYAYTNAGGSTGR